MSIHQKNKNLKPDSLYTKGSLKFLAEGNKCVLLDGRRTPGFIEKVDLESGMFIWKITDFEDKGRFWELPFEDIEKFQFLSDANIIDRQIVHTYKKIIEEKQKPLHITIDNHQQKLTKQKISQLSKLIAYWMEQESLFFQSKKPINLNDKNGSSLLFKDLQKYMSLQNLLYLEEETADRFCLNPNSGELIKGMKICLAEMGLVNYQGLATRKPSTFKDDYSKKVRKEYLIHRLAFIQAMFDNIGWEELTVYRGMTSEKPFYSVNRPLISTTVNLETAKEFFDDSNDIKYKCSYLLKLTLPVSQLLMTYLETKQFNKQYLEQEVIIMNTNQIPF